MGVKPVFNFVDSFEGYESNPTEMGLHRRSGQWVVNLSSTLLILFRRPSSGRTGEMSFIGRAASGW